MNEISDGEIILLFKSDMQKSFRLLVDRYKERLYWHIRKMLLSHEDTDDVLQNVFVKVWMNLKDFNSDSKLYTWLYRIATNEALNLIGERKRKVFGNTIEISNILEANLESDVYYDGDMIQTELQKAILKLTDKQRLVFNMKYFDDMKYNDMAEILNLSVGTLKATYHNAVKKIEETLKLIDIVN